MPASAHEAVTAMLSNCRLLRSPLTVRKPELLREKKSLSAMEYDISAFMPMSSSVQDTELIMKPSMTVALTGPNL